MSDEIKERLKETADHCVKSYEAWIKDKKDKGARNALQEAVHEMRKVASRLEIDLAVSERDQMTSNPIPVPPHRDARGRHQKPSNGPDAEENGDNKGNMSEKVSQGMKPRRKPPAKKAAED